MDEIEEVQQHNMISNLPLLFANGYPTSLEKIAESQLENFIPFMVQCSLGHINLQGNIDYSEPEWWPENVPYTIPFTKPKKFTGNWLEKMKEIVIICYQFHKSVFLLRFCNDLAAYEHASLRFINNYNSTTSLFDRRSNKLLVTFRNENMSYDQPQRSRKCLLQQKSKINSQQQHMVEPAPFDIYLCDNCDAELYSEEAIVEHEKTCNLDDDVIICDSPEPHEDNQLNLSSNSTENNELRIGFLLNFNLQSRDCSQTVKDSSCSNAFTNSTTKESKDASLSTGPLEKLKRLPRRNRAVHSLSRCPTIPLSSPAGQLLIKTSKTLMTQDYLMERLDRMERFCYAPILTKGSIKPKFLDKKYTSPVSHCTFKKPQDYNIHTYIFPRRQFSQRQRTENFMFLNSLLIKRCRPISVRLRKITDSEIVKRKRMIQSNKLNIKLTRDTSRSSNWKISSPSAEIIVDTIDLCSSDDEVDQKFAHTPHNRMSATPPMSSHTLELQLRLRLNDEITLTPIPREPPLVNGVARHHLPSSASPTVVAAATSTTNSKGGYLYSRVVPKEEVKAPPLNRYEGNIVLSPTQNGAIGTAAKPLQPSVILYSNYTTRPLSSNSFHATATSSTTPPASIINNNDLIVSSSYQNEENHLQSSSKKTTSVAEWYPASIAANYNSISSTHSNNSNSGSRTVGVSERSSRSLPLMQFGSTSRIVSIDLTS